MPARGGGTRRAGHIHPSLCVQRHCRRTSTEQRFLPLDAGFAPARIELRKPGEAAAFAGQIEGAAGIDGHAVNAVHTQRDGPFPCGTLRVTAGQEIARGGMNAAIDSEHGGLERIGTDRTSGQRKPGAVAGKHVSLCIHRQYFGGFNAGCAGGAVDDG